MATFEQAYDWSPALGPYETYHPGGAGGALLEVADGAGNQNIVFATLINKIHRLLRLQQARSQYTAVAADSTPIVITKKAIHHVGGNSRPNVFQSNARISIPFTFLTQEAGVGFSDIAFPTYAFFATAVAYSETGGTRVYFPVSCGVAHVPYTQTVHVNVIRTRGLNIAPFAYGDVIEATCMFVHPASQG
jgi:hypothetical protein